MAIHTHTYARAAGSILCADPRKKWFLAHNFLCGRQWEHIPSRNLSVVERDGERKILRRKISFYIAIAYTADKCVEPQNRFAEIRIFGWEWEKRK